MNRLVVCSQKTFRLNGFNIKRFTYPYCLHVLFLGMHCHWFKHDAEAFKLGVQQQCCWKWKNIFINR